MLSVQPSAPPLPPSAPSTLLVAERPVGLSGWAALSAAATAQGALHERLQGGQGGHVGVVNRGLRGGDGAAPGAGAPRIG